MCCWCQQAWACASRAGETPPILPPSAAPICCYLPALLICACVPPCVPLALPLCACPSAGVMATRTRVTVAGAIIAAVADLLLILLIGWHSDDGASGRTVHEGGTGMRGRGRLP